MPNLLPLNASLGFAWGGVLRLGSLFSCFPPFLDHVMSFLLLYGVTRCISWSDSHEVTTFLTLDNVYILCLYGLLGLVGRIYTLGCTDRLFRPNKRQFTSGLHLTTVLCVIVLDLNVA